MPIIYDNIKTKLIDGLHRVLSEEAGCSFCVGYPDLRGWDQIIQHVDRLKGGDEEHACRVLVECTGHPKKK
jgi:hypothetical protein